MNQKKRSAKPAANRAKYRPSGKTRAIADELRREIVGGALAPGDRLPTRIELVQRFSASPVTVQRAMERLAADGLVRARGKLGTRVCEKPPHQTRYALVFPGHPPHNRDGHDVPRFWLTLASQAAVVAREEGLEIAVHYLTPDQLDGAAALSLARQIRSHLLAGLILGGPPGPYGGSFLLRDEPSLPRVAICQPDMHYPRMGSIRLAGEQLPERAMQRLAAEGCKKVAVIANWGQGSDAFLAAAARHKLHMPAHWMQFVNISTPETAGNLAHLLMSHPEDRPDGLFIADDNLVESVAAGLVTAGVRVPADLKVLAHCNFPAAAGSVLPFVRLGYDAHAVLSAAIELIARTRAGAAPGVAEIPVVFEHETNAAVTAAQRG
jgi:DNA-binding LacI/PurR family transcriptional regulator